MNNHNVAPNEADDDEHQPKQGNQVVLKTCIAIFLLCSVALSIVLIVMNYVPYLGFRK